MTVVQEQKILVTDDSPQVLRAVKAALAPEGYTLEFAKSGEECLETIKKFKPQLVLLDLMLPQMHGIDVLRSIKSNPLLRHTGVIILTGKALMPDFQMAMENGADYYLTKPFEVPRLQQLIGAYFKGSLEFGVFDIEDICNFQEDEKEYLPPQVRKSTYAKSWGTRGSVSVCGVDYLRYGGNTVCLELRDGDDIIIIDAGTGIRLLGDELINSDVKNIHLVIGHTHWDHIMGLPFFAPVYSPNYNVNIYAARGFQKETKDVFSGMFELDFFPVRLDQMQAKIEFHEVMIKDTLEVGAFKVHFAYANHPGATLCFKIEVDGKKVGYATDNEFLLGYHGDPRLIDRNHNLLMPYEQIIEFYSDCDTLIHEAQYLNEDYKNKVGWGHSSVSNAAVLVKHTGVKEWIVTHHDPGDTDAKLLEKLQVHHRIIEDMGVKARVHMAYEGQVFQF